MDVLDLSSVAAMLLAISLATERLVAVVKTAFPRHFAEERKTESEQVDLVADRRRRLSVQFTAFVAAWATSSFLVPADATPLIGDIPLGTLDIPAPIVALLASSGSAFWAQLVGYSSALKDIAVQQRASSNLAFVEQAERRGVLSVGGGKAVLPPGGPDQDRKIAVLENLKLRGQPQLSLTRPQ